MPYYDKETIRAVGEIGLLTYLERTEPGELVRQGSGYSTKTHDSLNISNGKWYWFSRGIGGRNALTYLVKARGLSFTDAVAELLRLGSVIPAQSSVAANQKQTKFMPPPKAGGNENARAYLLRRGIREDVAGEQFESGAVYESSYTFANTGRTQAQIVFLGFDEKGEARYANIRAIGGGFKGDAAGSDKRYPFAIRPESPASTLHVFESAIDLLSFASILRHEHSDCSNLHMISLGGIQPPGRESRLPPAISKELCTHKEIRYVALHLDNDPPGREAARVVKEALEKDFKVIDSPPPKGKDYNDYLRIRYSGHTKPQVSYER